jgi:DNA-binding transcriptional LysR family regulator
MQRDRLGEQVAEDMIAIRIGPDLRMAVVAAPSYLATHPAPLTPHDLTRHDCINLRLPTLGGLYAWELGRDGAAVNVRVDGRLVFNQPALALQAAVQGFGLAFVLAAAAQTLIEAGQLVRVLSEWCPPLAGFHLCYPSRRQMTPAFALLVEALRYRGPG